MRAADSERELKWAQDDCAARRVRKSRRRERERLRQKQVTTAKISSILLCSLCWKKKKEKKLSQRQRKHGLICLCVRSWLVFYCLFSRGSASEGFLDHCLSSVASGQNAALLKLIIDVTFLFGFCSTVELWNRCFCWCLFKRKYRTA